MQDSGSKSGLIRGLPKLGSSSGGLFIEISVISGNYSTFALLSGDSILNRLSVMAMLAMITALVAFDLNEPVFFLGDY